MLVARARVVRMALGLACGAHEGLARNSHMTHEALASASRVCARVGWRKACEHESASLAQQCEIIFKISTPASNRLAPSPHRKT